jgi:hypothetical protein
LKGPKNIPERNELPWLDEVAVFTDPFEGFIAVFKVIQVRDGLLIFRFLQPIDLDVAEASWDAVYVTLLVFLTPVVESHSPAFALSPETPARSRMPTDPTAHTQSPTDFGYGIPLENINIQKSRSIETWLLVCRIIGLS